MKTCPVCGLDVEDSYLFCPDDGAKLIGEGSSDAAFNPAAESHAKPVETPVLNDSVVLQCGECAAEYPMTFVTCPVHQVPLTRRKVAGAQTAQAAGAEAAEPKQTGVDNQDQKYEGRFQEASSVSTSPPPDSFKIFGDERKAPTAQAPSVPYSKPEGSASIRRSRSGPPSILAFEDSADESYADEDAHKTESRYDAPSFRIVAATMVIGLVIFCVVAVYTFFSAGARKQKIARAAQAAAIADVIEPPPFVPTPESALEYQAAQSQQPTPEDGSQATPSTQHQDAPRPATARLADQRDSQPVTSPRPTTVSMNRAPNPSPSPVAPKTPVLKEAALGRIEPGSIDARLIRVRSMRTGSGVRYDLTFDLQDQSGRHAQWERMLISTRSASGISHTQAVPFVHRLGANGALTFTLSVEMRGNSEPDWHGRVVCTTTGEDNDGKPVRASFGASVSP